MSTKAKMDKAGSEVLDPTPMEIPVGFRRPPSLQEQVQRMIRTEMSDQASRNGQETFEESEDFGEGYDDDPTSPYELDYHPGLNREVTQAEMRSIKDGEREFDKNYSAYKEKLAKEKADDRAYRQKARKRREIARKKKAAR